MTRNRGHTASVKPLRLQGIYYAASGLWAVAHRRGFEAVTGRKTDYWLVRMVGLLAAVIGSVLLLGSRGGQRSRETSTLSVGAGLAFTAIDVVYVARRRIAPIYLGDALFHIALAGWALARRQRND